MKSKSLIIIAIILLITVFVGFETGYRQKLSPLSGKTIWHGNPSLPEIALTFDDGPNKKSTPLILDILKKRNIKATFFVVGKNLKENSDILIRINKEGHVIGNHTYYHLDGNNVKIDRIGNNLKWTDVLINKFTGKRPEYFRPPFGYENWRFLREAEKLNYSTILWSVDGGEWNEKATTEKVIRRITDNTQNGSIILLHDTEIVAQSLPKIIDKLRAKGFRFVTISQMVNSLN